MPTTRKLDAAQIDQAIGTLASAIGKAHAKGKRLLLLGIANGGVVLSQRLVDRLGRAGIGAIAGTIDISFHRDDIGNHPIPKETSPTLIPHDVNGASVILVDDVLHTGRTTKAALDELFDHGRPSRVELAVLIDRGGRRLPIDANFRGLDLNVPDNAVVAVALDAEDPRRDRAEVLPPPATAARRAS